jgi:hypothetical protein
MDLVGADNSVTSCDLPVFVDEAAEPVSSKHAAGRSGLWRRAACGRVLMQRPERTVGVVVQGALAHEVEMAWSGDQQVVEAFPAQSADEAFRDRVRPGCRDRGAEDPDVGTGEDCVERGGELMRISTSFAVSERASSASQLSTRASIR